MFGIEQGSGTQIEIPNEALDAGPKGYRVHVIDYDSTTDVLYPAARIHAGVNRDEPPVDPWEHVPDRELLRNSDFHAWMTYGVIMKTLARFEFAMGRRIGWSFPGHQIKVSPHGFNDANASIPIARRDCFLDISPAWTESRLCLPACLTRS